MNSLCQRCGWEWEARKINPRSCPNCHSYKWRLAREANHKDGDHQNNSLENLEMVERVVADKEFDFGA